MQALLRQFAQDHGNVSRLLELLERQRLLLREGGAFDARLTRRVLRYMVKYQDVFHHPKEDLLFARMLRRSPGMSDVLTFLEREHQLLCDQGTAIYVRLGSDVDHDEGAQLEQALAVYSELLMRHMETENSQVFPNARLALGSADWDEIDMRIDATPDPIFRDNVEKGYRIVIDALAKNRKT